MSKWIILIICFVAAIVAVTILTTVLTWGKQGLKKDKTAPEEAQPPAELIKVTKQTSATFNGTIVAVLLGIVSMFVSVELPGWEFLRILGIALFVCAGVLLVLNIVFMHRRSVLRKKYKISQTI